jgi:outer membrane protein OmpA-like peptidoglycan-associated protein
MAILVAAVFAGCSSMPASDSPLAQARSAYTSAQSDPQVASLAAGELKQASDSLDKANTAQSKGENGAVVDHLAYIAKQQVAIAQATAVQKAAELAVANAATERDKVRLEARTREADSAQRSAQAAQRQAEASQRQAEASQRSAEASQRVSEAARRDAEASQRVAMAERQAATDAQVSAQAARQQTLDAEGRARALEAQLKEMEAKKTDRGMVITLGDVLFDTNQAQLKPGGMRNLQRLADFFKQYPQRNVMIEGFTDSTGGASRNQILSDDRAYAVRTALLGMGIGTDRISSKGYGESYPVAGNDTAAGRQLNRRVEIIVSDDSGKIAPR